MKRLAGLAILALAAALLAARAQAQEVYASADVQYDWSCNCAVGNASYDDDSIAELYYVISFNSEMYDQDGFFDQASDISPAAWQDDTAILGDEYAVDASVDAELDSDVQNCPTAPCSQFGSVSNDCPDVPTPPELDDFQSASAVGTCDQGDDLDSIINEYSNVTNPPIPGCGDFTPAVGGSAYSVPELPYSNSVIFSHGNYTDWAIFNPDLINGVNGMNTTTLPSGAPSDIALPLPLTSVYRTPIYNASIPGAPMNEGHQHGIAFDSSTNGSSKTWADYAAWAQVIMVQELGGSQPVCIEPGNFNGSNFTHLHVDWRPSVDMPLNPCPAHWTAPIPSWAQ
ncbi:MAG: hypothetical protein ACRD1L_06490 [Terriglobales bacterium]